MSNDNLESVKYSVESTDENSLKEVGYSIVEDKDNVPTCSSDSAAVGDNLGNSDTLIQVEETQNPTNTLTKNVGNDVITIAASFTAKGYTKEYVYIGMLLSLALAGALIAAFVKAYSVAGIVIAILSAFAAFALIRHIFDSKKIVKLVTSGECATITELMSKTGKKRREDLVRTVGGIIRDGHLTGYALLGDERFEQRSPHNDTEENQRT